MVNMPAEFYKEISCSQGPHTDGRSEPRTEPQQRYFIPTAAGIIIPVQNWQYRKTLYIHMALL